MDQFLPSLNLIWRPIEFASVGGIDALYKEYRRVIKAGGHAWWTQRLSLSYVRLLDRILEEKGPVYLYPVEDPREAGNQIFKLRARIGAVVYNPDGSFVLQPDDNLPYRRGEDRIYSSCWLRLDSMEVIPFEEMPDPARLVVLPYGDDIFEALGGKFSKGFIIPGSEYEAFRKTNLAQRLESMERSTVPVGGPGEPLASKLYDFEKRIAQTVSEDATAGESAFDVLGSDGFSVQLEPDTARRIAEMKGDKKHELRLDTSSETLIIGSADLEREIGGESSYGEINLDLARGRVVSRNEVDTFELDRELSGPEESGDLSREERQLIELGIDWDVMRRMRETMARVSSGEERTREEHAVGDSQPSVAEFDSSPGETEPDATSPGFATPTGGGVPTFGGDEAEEPVEEPVAEADETPAEAAYEPSRASLPTPEDIARALREAEESDSDNRPMSEIEYLTEARPPEPADLPGEATDSSSIEPLERIGGGYQPTDADEPDEEPDDEPDDELDEDLPEPARTSRELEESPDEEISFPDLPPLKQERAKERVTPPPSGLNLFFDEVETAPAPPPTGSSESLLIPTVDSLLRNAEAREQSPPATREPSERPLALPREVASGIRKIREHLIIDSEQIAHIITNLLLGKHVMIGGPTGCGKTTLARLIPSLIWNIYPEMVQSMSSWSGGDLLGQVYPLPDGGSAVSGILTRTILKNYTAREQGYQRAPYRAPNGAQYEGVWLVLDELDNCDWDDLISDFLAASDADHLRVPVVSSPGEHLQIPLPKDFRLLATFNDPDGPDRLSKLTQSTRRRLAFVELHSPSDEASERKAVRRTVQATVYEQLGLATRESELGGRLEDTLFRFVRLIRCFRDIGTAPLITILADVQVETQMGLEAWKTLDEAVATNLVPLLGGMDAGALRIIGNLAANTPERIHAYLASNLPRRYAEEGFRLQLHSYLEFLRRTSRHRGDELIEDLEELVELVSTGIPQGEVQPLVRALELREGNLGTTLIPAVKLGTTLFETIRRMTRMINVAQGRR